MSMSVADEEATEAAGLGGLDSAPVRPDFCPDFRLCRPDRLVPPAVSLSESAAGSLMTGELDREQVSSLPHFCSVDFSQSRISAKECVFK